jgi:hypothetical protein
MLHDPNDARTRVRLALRVIDPLPGEIPDAREAYQRFLVRVAGAPVAEKGGSQSGSRFSLRKRIPVKIQMSKLTVSPIVAPRTFR